MQVSDSVNIKQGDTAAEPQNEPLRQYTPMGNGPRQQTSTKPGVVEEQIPVCKIVSKKEAHQQQERRKNEAKEKRKASAVTSSVKTLELNWAIDPNDLAHRLDRIQEFLSEGRKVEIILAAKKKGRKANAEECEGVLQKIRTVVKGIDGAKEERPMEGKLGGFSTLSFAGRPPKVQREAAVV